MASKSESKWSTKKRKLQYKFDVENITQEPHEESFQVLPRVNMQAAKVKLIKHQKVSGESADKPLNCTGIEGTAGDLVVDANGDGYKDEILLLSKRYT